MEYIFGGAHNTHSDDLMPKKLYGMVKLGLLKSLM